MVVAIGGRSMKEDWDGEDSLEHINLENESEWTTKSLPGFKIQAHCSVAINDKELMLIGGKVNSTVNLISASEK